MLPHIVHLSPLSLYFISYISDNWLLLVPDILKILTHLLYVNVVYLVQYVGDQKRLGWCDVQSRATGMVSLQNEICALNYVFLSLHIF